MQKIQFVMLPPDPARKGLDNMFRKLLCGLYPALWYYWKTKPEAIAFWVPRFIAKHNFTFCQFGTWLLARFFRGWLRRGTYAYLAHENNPQGSFDKGINFFDNPMRYVRSYNCPPASCKIKLRKGKGLRRRSTFAGATFPRNSGAVFPRKCRHRLCPHCHFRRAVRIVNQLRYAVRYMKPHYPNLHGFLYEIQFPETIEIPEMRQEIYRITKAVRKHKGYYGDVWHVRPYMASRKDLRIVFRFRILVAGAGGFELDDPDRSPDLKLLRSWPLEAYSITKLVAQTLSWGRWPFWYQPGTESIWNKFLDGQDIFNARGCMSRNRNHKVYDRFRQRYDVKKQRKNLLFGLDRTGNQAITTVS